MYAPGGQHRQRLEKYRMFVLKNAWAALTRHKWRSLLTIITALIVTFGTMFSTAVIQASDTAYGSGYDAQKPTFDLKLKQSVQSKYNGADSSWTKNYLSWTQYSTYASAAQSASISFTYTFTESVPVRQTSKFKAVAGTADQDASKTGGELTLRTFYSKEAAAANAQGAFTIVRGKNLSYSTSSTDSTSALISETVAKKNNLKVGDTFTIASPTNAKTTVKLKVAGIYRYKDEQTAASTKLAKDNRDNAIFVGYYAFAINNFDTTTGKGWAVPDLQVTFTLDSVSAYKKFVALVKKAKLPTGYEIVSTSLEAYTESIKPLGKLAERLRIARIVLLIVGGLLLVVLVMLGLVHRRGEIATAMLVGVTKARIAWQFMLEVLFPTVFGFAIGALAGGFGTKPLAHQLAGGYDVTTSASLVWQTIGYGLLACLVLSFIAMFRVVAVRRISLFAPRDSGDYANVSNVSNAESDDSAGDAGDTGDVEDAPTTQAEQTKETKPTKEESK